MSLLNVDWDALKTEYETDRELSLEGLAKRHGISRNTVVRRAQVYHWLKVGDEKKRLVRAATRVTDSANAAIVDTCKRVAAEITAKTEATLKELQPWIEEQRAEHVKYIVGLSRKALKRIDTIFEANPPHNPKDEQFSAAATEKHDAIIRRNLGMGDSGGTNTLNVAVLTGGRSITEVKESPEKLASVTISSPEN